MQWRETSSRLCGVCSTAAGSGPEGVYWVGRCRRTGLKQQQGRGERAEAQEEQAGLKFYRPLADSQGSAAGEFPV